MSRCAITIIIKMKRKIFITLPLLCTVLICLATTVDLGGKWKGSVQTDAGASYPITYIFKPDGDKLNGTVQTPVGSFPLNDGKIKADSIFFNVSYNGMIIPTTGRCYPDSIGLSVAMGGLKFHTVLRRDQ